MNHDNTIQKIKSGQPYKNGTIVLGTTGSGLAVETIDTYVTHPTSPSGEMNWDQRFVTPGEFIYTTAAP